MTIYTIPKDEVLQMVADFLSKKYQLAERFEANIELSIDNTGELTVTVNEKPQPPTQKREGE